jgi:ubiquinone/menaquinone biosynthesis C-methylase UbiE
MDKYNAKKIYSNQDLVESYDYDRFTSAGGKVFDAIEKNIVLQNIPLKERGISVLEVGSGTGRFTIELAKLGLNVTTCDISTPMLKKIKEKLLNLDFKKNITLTKGDIYNLPFKDNSFDYVVCIRVLNQLGEKQNKNKALKELCRVCIPNGSILFDFINSRSLTIFAGADKKSGVISVNEMKRFVDDISGIRIIDMSGRLIVSQTLLEKSPKYFLKFIEKIDYLLCKCFFKYATRVYFVLKKFRTTANNNCFHNERGS